MEEKYEEEEEKKEGERGERQVRRGGREKEGEKGEWEARQGGRGGIVRGGGGGKGDISGRSNRSIYYLSAVLDSGIYLHSPP